MEPHLSDDFEWQIYSEIYPSLLNNQFTRILAACTCGVPLRMIVVPPTATGTGSGQINPSGAPAKKLLA
jgi:hypothetical protein